MRILFLTNNANSEPLIQWLRNDAKEEVLVSGAKATDEKIKEYNPDWMISYNYRYLIEDRILNSFKNRVINLHYSLLPWNRGAYSNLWSFLKDTPKGVTIHIIDAGIDTGDILVQKEIQFDEEKETLFSSYETLQDELQKLFILSWQKIKNFQVKAMPQSGEGSVYYVRDFERIKSILDGKGWDIRICELKKRYKNYQVLMGNNRPKIDEHC